MKKYPLLPSQSGVFIENIRYPESTQYNLPLFFELPFAVDEERLTSAWQTLFEKKSVFKLRFCQDASGVPYQWYDETLKPCVKIYNCAEQDILQKAESEIRPFDLLSGEPLVRVILFITEQRKYMFTDVHHIIMDGGSFTVLFRNELKKAYAGENVEDDMGMLHEAENATALSESEAEEYEAAGDYFKKKFSDVEFLTFGNGDPLPGNTVMASSYVEKEACDVWCGQAGVSPAVLFQAAFNYCMGTFSGQENIAYGMAYHNRTNENRKKSLGMYAGVVPVLAELPGNISIRDYFARVREEQKEAASHAVFPVSDFFKELNKIPKIHFCFNAGKNVNIALQLDKSASPMVFLNRPVIQSDITVYVLNSDKGYKIQVDSSDKVNKQEILNKLAEALSESVRNMMVDPDRKLREVSVLSETGKKEIIALSRGETLLYDKSLTWLDLFRKQVKAFGEALAVTDRNGSITYSELDRQSDRIAEYLVNNNVKPDDFVAIKMGRVKEFVISVIGIQKAGAAYVPVDPEYPKDRIAYMLENSGAGTVLTESLVSEILDNAKNAESAENVKKENGYEFKILAKPENHAYMIYTSGSTGKPKGVVINESCITACAAWLINIFELKPGKKSLHHPSFSFDASTFDLFYPLAAGAGIYILDEEQRKDTAVIASVIKNHEITGMTVSTAMGMALLDGHELDLEYMMLGGEKLMPVKNTAVKIFNGYGPTEFTVCSSYHVVDQSADKDIPIGRPVPNTWSFICDKYGNLLPQGITGELCLAGPQISDGYWNESEKTEKAFVDCPYLPGRKMYRTGDLAFYNKNGELEYVGRIDHQVKLRGFRIELGEIENCAASFKGISQVSAQVVKDRLVLYFTVSENVDTEALKEYMSGILTGYMVPDVFMCLEKFPMTPNGKINRKALPVPEIHGTAYAAPENETEAAVAEAMADVLNLSSQVGRDDDFILLGGDSIKSIRLVSKLRAAGVTVAVADIMRAKTVKGIAASAESVTAFTAEQSDWSGEVPLTAVQTLFFNEWKLAKPWHFNQSQMLTASEPVDADTLRASLDALARHHDMLRAVYADNVQRVRAVEGEGPLYELTVIKSDDGKNDDSSIIERNAELVQASFDLANGPLFKAVLFKGKEADHVLLVIHHFIVDGISWRILIEDLETSYGQLRDGSRVSLPAKTMSMRDWRAAIDRYAGSNALRRELGYWRDVDLKIAAMPHTTDPNPNYCAGTQELVRTLDANTFATLRGKASNAYHTEINDLLMTALGRAYAAVTGERALSVELEGHGREPINEEAQIDRTVGWFTSVYPVIIETSEDIRTSIRGVKETLRRIPNHGLGYGVLRHLAKEKFQDTEPVPTVSFNYLGTFNEGGAKELFRIDDSLPQGCAIAAENVFGPAMAVNCLGTSAGTLKIIFTYDPEVWNGTRASALADSFVREMEAVTAHTLSVELPEKTASDLGETVWFDAEFLAVEREFASRGEVIERLYPLMPMQEGMLLEALSAPESYVYNVASRYALQFLPEKATLERALGRLLARHEVLRTAVICRGVCEPRQAIVSGRTLPITFVDLSDAQDIGNETAALAQREFERPIDLQRDPLFRIVRIKTSASSCQLLFVVHHIVTDGWCQAIYLGDLMKYLREEMDGTAGPEDNTAMTGRYERHVRGIVERDRSEALAYWRSLLDGYETRAEVPAYENVTDANRSPLYELTFDLPENTTKRLTELCRADGCTVNNAVEAAWGLLLQKYNRTDDAVFVKVVSGRDHADMDVSQNVSCDVSDIVGIFINSVPVRVRTEKNATLLDLVKSQQRQAGRTSANDWVPLAEIQRESALGANLFQSILAFENYETGDVGEIENPSGQSGQSNQFGLHLVSRHETNVSEIAVAAYESDNRLGIDLKFDTGKYILNEMRRLMNSFRHILCAIAETPDKKACEVPLLDDAETAALVALGSGAALAYDHGETFIDMFARHVAADSAAKAVVAANGTLTYGELDSESDALAAKLISCGVNPGDFVAVKLDRVKEFPLAVIAIWKAGAAYVPVDPEYPEERIAYMLEDSGAKIIIDEAFIKNTQLNCAGVNLAAPSGLAYMIYTSGSTGKPKGAMVSHANLWAFLAWLTDELRLKAGEAVAEHASFSFDASICDLYTSLSCGATLHIISSELRKDLDGLAKYLIDNAIIGATFSTQFGMELLNACELKLRYAILGGEKLKHVKKTSVRIYNAYGPTEFTCVSSYHVVDQINDGEDIPIGRAVPNSISAIVDASGNLLPRGMVGELVLSGDQLSQGYWNRPELNAEKFVKLPWLEQRVYRTGDLARWNETGELIYCGRIDHQVKLRGFRIELGEIESAMVNFPGIVSAVAEVKNINGTQRLCAYYVPNADGGIDEAALKSELYRSLTGYMVPDVFIRLEKLPMTPNGKINRKALPVPEIKAEEIVAPGTEQEKALFNVVAEELKTREFGVTTNLISMGLTSLRAIRLSAAIRKATGFVVPTGEILAKPYIRDWAALEKTEAETIAVLSPQKIYPLTANQLGVYLDWEHNRTGLQYNVPSALRYDNIDASKLRDAVKTAVAAHPYFNVHLELRDGTPVQVRRDDAPVEVLFTGFKYEHEPDAAFFQARVRPFDLLNDDLARFEIYALNKAAYLFIDVHHIIYDGGAVNILMKAINDALTGAEPVKETVSAYDYAIHYAAWQSSDAYAKAGAYFNKLIAETESFLYPSARSSAAASGNVANIITQVPINTIRAKCREIGVTENAFFATAFCETLRRVSRTDDIQIETVSNGRSLTQLADTIGMFVETLPLVSRRTNGSVAETVRTMQSQIAETIRYDRYPFTKLAEQYSLKPNVIYVYQGDVIDHGLPLGITSVPLELDTAKVPLALTVTPDDGNYVFVIEYDTGLYAPEEIESLARMLKCLSLSLADLNADAPFSEASLVNRHDTDQLLALGRGKTIDYNHIHDKNQKQSQNETFIGLFRSHVQAAPDAKAVVASNGALTYGELDAQSSALAAALIETGVNPGDFVAVMLGRVKEFPLSVIAVWKAGAAYVPVDPEYPEERIAYMLKDSGAKLVIDEAFLKNTQLNRACVIPAVPSELAYMIYTSGSTGKPKGVMVTHANLRAYLAWRTDLVGARPGEAFAHYTSFGFDASMDDLVTPLAAGATVHILSETLRMDMEGLRQYLNNHAIVGLTLPTQFGMQLLNDDAPLTLRYLMMGGEKLKPTKKTSVRVINGYGPTEFTVCSSYHIVDPEKDGENIPIGRPVPNSISAIVDPVGGLLPRGMVGELVLAGDQLTNGYWNRPELTAEKFVKLPWLAQRVYRTGDLARWNENGELIYCGRIDNQVKLRGFRIEMGEIESAMASFPGIISVVAEVKNINGTEHLCAYYVSNTELDEAALKSQLSKSLTGYMVPDVFLRLEKLPMTPNGKVNRKALPVPDAGILAGEYIEPATPEERALCEAYGRILDLSKYGAETDFFSAGGSSLIGIRLVAELQRLGFNVVYGDVFKYKTPRALAAFLAGSDGSLKSDRKYAIFSAGSYDYSDINALLAQTPDEPCDGIPVNTMNNILLTGVTGYLGVHILKQLLDITACSVTLLVRSKKDRTPEECVAENYYYYFEQVLSEEAAGRISFVEGDITDDNLAGKLSDVRFDTVFNCAALVKHYVADDMLDRVNVDGVRNLVEICASRSARLIQISTYSIGGVAAPGTVLDERHFYVEQTSDNDYVRTKFEAERLVLEAIAAGRIRGKIMRLGNLMGREKDGVFQLNFHANAFVNSIRTFVQLRAYPLANAAMPAEFSQIDSVAESVVRLSMTPDSMVVFHPFNPCRQNFGAVIDAVNAIGLRIDFVSKAEFSARVEAMRNDPAHAEALQGILHYGQRSSENRLPVQASNDWTVNVLRRLGFLWKMPEAGYMEKFFKFLDDLKFFD